VRNTVEWILRELGYQTLTASSGEGGLGVFKNHRAKIAAVLSDVVMPGLSGVELVRELRSLDYTGPIILMSGYFPKAGIDPREFSQSIDGFLQKPVRTRDLAKVLDRCLSESSEQSAPRQD
jgi:two-component system, cell cycle sensor histidine kinase and response regulator CckA